MYRSRQERLVNLLLGAVTVAVFLVLYAPVVLSALFSIVPFDRAGLHWEQSTFDWYVRLASNGSVLASMRMTLIVAFISVVIATAMAIVIGLYVEWEGAILRNVVGAVVYLPFLMPPIITGLSLLVFSDFLGLPRGVLTLVIGHAALVLAILYRLVLTRLQSIPKNIIEASADLGASRGQTFVRVIWPQLRSAVITGAVLALTISFDETLVSVFLAGDMTTLPLRLWGMMRVGFTPEINALVTIILTVSIILTVIVALRLKSNTETER